MLGDEFIKEIKHGTTGTSVFRDFIVLQNGHCLVVDYEHIGLYGSIQEYLDGAPGIWAMQARNQIKGQMKTQAKE